MCTDQQLPLADIEALLVRLGAPGGRRWGGACITSVAQIARCRPLRLGWNLLTLQICCFVLFVAGEDSGGVLSDSTPNEQVVLYFFLQLYTCGTN